jgi:hypothetical protein
MGLSELDCRNSCQYALSLVALAVVRWYSQLFQTTVFMKVSTVDGSFCLLQLIHMMITYQPLAKQWLMEELT